MSTDKLRVGVIGASARADQVHLPGLLSRPDVDVVALCGRNQARLDELAARYNIRQTFTDWARMIARSGLDVAVIVTPNALHYPQALAAIQVGTHVICEKPVALNAAQARELAARADTAGVKAMTFFSHRAIAAATHVKKLVDEGILGDPLHVNAMYLSASRLDPDKPLEWRMVRAQAGAGVADDIGSHLVDLVRWWLGDVSQVSAMWQTAIKERPGGQVDTDDVCTFMARLACGAQAVFQANQAAAGRGNDQRIELYGTKGALVYEAEPGYGATWEGRVYAGKPGTHGLKPAALPKSLVAGLNTEDPQADRNEAYRRLTHSFFKAIRSGGTVSPDFYDGAAVQAVLDAVAQSAENGKWVNVL